MKKDRRILKKPKFKIGDIVAFQQPSTGDGLQYVVQGEIKEARAFYVVEDRHDELDWSYYFEDDLIEDNEGVTEQCILYKL